MIAVLFIFSVSLTTISGCKIQKQKENDINKYVNGRHNFDLSRNAEGWKNLLHNFQKWRLKILEQNMKIHHKSLGIENK
ncbi:hypothetical protein HHI36_002313 [Cryptolaemus montrouzieri]|uniref:Lipoprotein n=1 Tax=Cryptolaemus montrouzieri TaxID=559131 RepID=A0ABD2PBK4_9CUCU